MSWIVVFLIIICQSFSRQILVVHSRHVFLFFFLGGGGFYSRVFDVDRSPSKTHYRRVTEPPFVGPLPSCKGCCITVSQGGSQGGRRHQPLQNIFSGAFTELGPGVWSFLTINHGTVQTIPGIAGPQLQNAERWFMSPCPLQPRMPCRWGDDPQGIQAKQDLQTQLLLEAFCIYFPGEQEAYSGNVWVWRFLT